MKAKPAKGRVLKRVLAGVLLIGLVGVGGIFAYCWQLSAGIEQRFAGRRWRIPSRVFSSTTLLYPGQRIGRKDLRARLNRLGYRKTTHPPARKGQLQPRASALDLFLHDLNAPARKREGFPVRIGFEKDRIRSIVRLDRKEPVALLELEPEEITLFFGAEREKRQLVSIGQISQHLIHAVVAAEDNRFFQHHGIDPRGLLRALYVNLRHGDIRQGGSTITQQLAKNYFLTPQRTLQRKIKEFLMALTLEALYAKNEILEIYLNEIYLGQNGSISINGVGEAAYFYFGKSAAELSITESATLAGLIKGPNLYSPYRNKARCRRRRDQVLQAMESLGWITAEQRRRSIKTPLAAAGFTPRGRVAPYFIDYLAAQLTALYPPQALSSLGLSIYTTLDTQVQIAAEAALTKGLTRLETANPALKRATQTQVLQGAVLVMQPKTGYILAMVGGRDFALSQFNRITQAKRQSGSTFKPFVYLAALEQFTPVSRLTNAPKSYAVDGTPWQPRNFEPASEPLPTLRTSLAKSYNLATVDLAMRVGLGVVVDTAAAFGFSTPLKPFPSLALGAFEVIPLELARAYCGFAADGVQPYPLSLKAVVDENGSILERKHTTIAQVTSPAKAYLMNSLLRSVVTEGTARSLRSLGVPVPVAAKTGTTNGFKDAWFVGYTPDILALVWVGFDDGSPVNATGATAALPIWADLVKSIPQYLSGEWFQAPPGAENRTVCAETGYLAVEKVCPQTVDEIFLVENMPTETCPLHRLETPTRPQPETPTRPLNPLHKFFEGVKNFFKKL